MTQEHKDLLLKDLCSRLPYGVKILIKDTFKYSIVLSEHHVLDVSNFSDIFSFKYKKLDKRMKKAMRERPEYIVIKPYLLPMSSMTEEQQKEYRKVCDLDMTILENRPMKGEPFPAMYNSQDWLDANHFDYRGLIEKGLAIDATGLSVYTNSNE